MAVLSFLFFHFYAHAFGFNKLGAFIFSTIAIVFAFNFYVSKISKSVKVEFKSKIMPIIIKDINPDLVYEKDKFITKNEFLSTEIYSPDISFYGGNDLVNGKADDILVKFSDALVKRVQKDIQNGKEIKKEIVVFQGVLFIAKFNKKINSITQIIDKKANFIKTNGDRAYMDDATFESHFKTYTNDQINARYLLTPKFMQDFCELKRIFKAQICAVLKDEFIYIYINLGKDSFELDMKNTLDQDNLNAYKKEIATFLDIVKNLNLNNNLFCN